LVYVKDKIYFLGMPSDGLCNDQIVRFPIGLPVKFVRQTEDRLIVIEPHGDIVEFPLTCVWRLGEDIDIFKKGVEQREAGEPLLLKEFATEKAAQECWYRFTHPDEFRWYPASLNDKFAYAYCDYEAMWGMPVRAIQAILSEIHDMMYRGSYFRELKGDAVVWMKDAEELATAIADITLLVTAGEGDIAPEDEPFVKQTVHTVYDLLTTKYYVKSGAVWDFENRKFVSDDVIVDMKSKPEDFEE